MQPKRKQVIDRARRKYAKMREENPLVDELQRRFGLRVDVSAEMAECEDEEPDAVTER